jgi:hypothetical protein
MFADLETVAKVNGGMAPFAPVAGLMEYLCDDLEEIAVRKGGIGQPMFDKWRKLNKVMPPKHILTLTKSA